MLLTSLCPASCKQVCPTAAMGIAMRFVPGVHPTGELLRERPLASDMRPALALGTQQPRPAWPRRKHLQVLHLLVSFYTAGPYHKHGALLGDSSPTAGWPDRTPETLKLFQDYFGRPPDLVIFHANYVSA